MASKFVDREKSAEAPISRISLGVGGNGRLDLGRAEGGRRLKGSGAMERHVPLAVGGEEYSVAGGSAWRAAGGEERTLDPRGVGAQPDRLDDVLRRHLKKKEKLRWRGINQSEKGGAAGCGGPG